MSDLLVLIGGDQPDAPMGWARASADGRVLEHGVTDETPPPAAAPSRTVLVLPGADARVRRLDLPARSEAQARAGAALLFGSSLSNPGDTHYAVGAAQDRDGVRLAAAMSEARLSAWLERCREIGADPHIVALDCTLWPSEPGAVVIAAHPSRVIVAGGELGGFSIEPELAAPLLRSWLAENGAGGVRLVLQGGDAAAWRAALGEAGSRLETAPAADPVAALAMGAANAPNWVPNLRQGKFAARERGAEPFKLWRFAALLAAAALLLQIGTRVIEGWRDHAAAAQIMAAAERDFRAARPDVTRIVNLRAQVAALTNAMEQSGRHPVLVVTAPLVNALRRQPLARIDEVRHDGGGRDVRVRISAPQQPAVDALIEALRAEGISVDVRNSQPRDGRYAAELAVTAP